MRTRKHYDKIFADYPDVVRLEDLQVMLGGITHAAAVQVLQQGHIKFYYIHRKHLIPKVCIIDYLMGAKRIPPKEQSVEQIPGKRHKPGTGCLTQISAHLWEGKYSPRDAYGKRIHKNVYAKTRATCEKKLMTLIAKTDREILAQKEKLQETE